MKLLRIGEVTQQLQLSADTLRYYEKIGLLPRVARTEGGQRLFEPQDLSRLRFIQRAQKMGFSLDEIAHLLDFRAAPQQAKPQIRRLATEKLALIEQHVQDLTHLRNELTLLVNLCTQNADGCPIIEGIEGKEGDTRAS